MTRTLLIQSCSASKDESATGSVPARELYTGYFHRIIDKARRENAINPGIDMVILSAKYGIIEPDDEIKPYDQVMTNERAEEMNEEIVREISQRVADTGYDVIVVNAGREYRSALRGIGTIDATLYVNGGSGNGEMGSNLKTFLRTGRVDQFDRSL